MADNLLKHRFRGRRKGKTLTAYRQSLLENDFQGYKITKPEMPFNNGNDTWLEIGFGNGEFLANMSQSHDHINFIGCEPFVNGVTALLSYIEKPVSNLKIWNDDARLLIDEIDDNTISRVYLLNPDPWPKKKHFKRRFINNDILDDLSRILKSGGDFIMSTDVIELAQWMYWHTWSHPDFEWMDTSMDGWLLYPSDWPLDKTRYMKKALAGETIYWLKFKRK